MARGLSSFHSRRLGSSLFFGRLFCSNSWRPYPPCKLLPIIFGGLKGLTYLLAFPSRFSGADQRRISDPPIPLGALLGRECEFHRLGFHALPHFVGVFSPQFTLLKRLTPMTNLEGRNSAFVSFYPPVPKPPFLVRRGGYAFFFPFSSQVPSLSTRLSLP